MFQLNQIHNSGIVLHLTLKLHGLIFFFHYVTHNVILSPCVANVLANQCIFTDSAGIEEY